MHDLSKFSPTEFFEGVKYWTGKRSPILIAKEKTGISYAWLHHRGRNKHHYEYWIDKLDQGGIPHRIPFEYVVEMVCDWLAACRTYTSGGDNVFLNEYEWWTGNAPKVKIHNDTKLLITKILWNLAELQRHNGNENKTLEEVSMSIKFWERMYNDPSLEQFIDYD